MSTAKSTMRQAISKKIGEYISGACDASCTDTIIYDTDLSEYEDDELNDRYLIMTSGDEAGEMRRISDFLSSTGEVTLAAALSGSPSATETFEIHTIRPSRIHDAIDRAIQAVYPELCQVKNDETLFVRPKQYEIAVPSAIEGEPLQIWLEEPVGYDFAVNILKDYNGGFEDWTNSTLDEWDTASNITISKVSATAGEPHPPVKAGNYSAKGVVAATSIGTQYNTISTPANYDSQKLTFSMWVYCTVADRVSVRITDNSSNTASSTHGGGGWERLIVTHTVCASPTSLTCGLYVTSGVTITVYLDDASLVRAVKKADKPAQRLFNWKYEGGTVRFPFQLTTSTRQLRLVGIAHFSAVTTDASTTELDEPEIQALYAEAIAEVYRRMKAEQVGTGASRYDAEIAYWEREAYILKSRYTTKKPTGTVKVSGWTS